MRDEHFDVNIPSKFSSTEEAILAYLYVHPCDNIGTGDLARILKSEQDATEAFDQTQYGIETLVAERLVKGKRVSESGKVQYIELRLTTKGEEVAINEQRRARVSGSLSTMSALRKRRNDTSNWSGDRSCQSAFRSDAEFRHRP